MDSTERVRNAIQGKPLDRQPIYGWVSANLSEEIADVWGSVTAFEDHYEFDMANMWWITSIPGGRWQACIRMDVS